MGATPGCCPRAVVRVVASQLLLPAQQQENLLEQLHELDRLSTHGPSVCYHCFVAAGVVPKLLLLAVHTRASRVAVTIGASWCF